MADENVKRDLPHTEPIEATQTTDPRVAIADTDPSLLDETLKRNLSHLDPTETTDPRVAIADKDRSFLEKVVVEGGFADFYDARDFANVVFRVMRDLMTTEAADRVAEELHEEVMPTKEKALQMEVTDLWKDTNPLVAFLSRVRPPWQGPGIFKIDSDRFFFRVANESGFERGPENRDVARKQAVKAVFAATKKELSEERIQEVASWLPENGVRELWDEA